MLCETRTLYFTVILTVILKCTDTLQEASATDIPPAEMEEHVRTNRTLLFIDAIHIDDDKRLLISSHMFALCFTDSVSWLEFL